MKIKRIGFKKKKAVRAFLIGATFTIGLSLMACGTKSETSSSTEPPATDLSVADLVANHGTATDKFLTELVLDDIVKASVGEYREADLLDLSFDLGDGQAKTLESVAAVFTYKEGDERLWNVNQMQFGTDVDLNQIAQYDENKSALGKIVDEARVSPVFEKKYDPLEAFMNDERATAIFENIIDSGEKPVHLALEEAGEPQEVAIYDDSIKTLICYDYNLVVQTEDSLKSYRMWVRYNEDLDKFIENLETQKDYKIRETSEHWTFDTRRTIKEYEKETFDIPDKIGNIGELLEKYPTETYAFLDSCTAGIVEEVTGSQHNEDSLKYVRYDIGDNALKELNALEIEFIVSSGGNKETYYRADLQLDKPTSLDDIANSQATIDIGHIEKTSFGYDARENFLRQELVDSLLKKVGMGTETAVHALMNFDSWEMIVLSDVGSIEYSFKVTEGASDSETIGYINDASESEIVLSKTNRIPSNAYISQHYVEKGYSIDTIGEALKYRSETIKENLDVLFHKMFRRYYSDLSIVPLGYKWDLGEAKDGKLSDARLLFIEGIGDNIRGYRVWNQLNESRLGLDLSLETITTPHSFDDYVLPYSPKTEFIFSYDTNYPSFYPLGVYDRLIKLVAEKTFTDGFDFSEALVLVKVGSSLHETFGEARSFHSVFITDQGIREFLIYVDLVQGADTEEKYIEKVNQGLFTVQFTNFASLDFSEYQIDKDLTSSL